MDFYATKLTKKEIESGWLFLGKHASEILKRISITKHDFISPTYGPVYAYHNIWIDTCHIAYNESILQKYNIDCVINCGLEDIIEYKQIEVVNLPIDDGVPLNAQIRAPLFQIHRCMFMNKKLMITCPGRSDRSIIIGLTYIMMKSKVPLQYILRKFMKDSGRDILHLNNLDLFNMLVVLNEWIHKEVE
jgi:hypothetical protein